MYDREKVMLPKKIIGGSPTAPKKLMEEKAKIQTMPISDD